MLASFMPSALASDGTMNGWWGSWANITQSSFTIAPDNSTSRTGQWSLKMTNTNPSQDNHYGMANTQINGLEKGKMYKIGISVKSDNARGKYLSLNWKQQFLMNLSNTHDWTDMEYVYTHEYDTTSEYLLIIVNNVADGLWIDDVYVREILGNGQYGENLISNSTFEVGEIDDGEGEANELNELYKKIMASDTFKLSDMKKVLGAFKYAPVYKADGIEIDGNMDDWEGYPQFGLPTKPDQYHIYKQGCNRDASGYCQYAYDEENFYLGIVVDDDIFEGNITKEFYWNADSIQIAMCDVDESYDAEIGFSHDPATDKGYVFSSNYSDEELKKVNLKTSLKQTANGVRIVYEAAIPWSLKYGDEPLPKGFLFDVIINDGDGNKRAYCIELAPGIAEGKISTEFPYLEFMTDKKDFYGWADGDRKLKVGEEKAYSYYFVNEGNGKDVTFTIPQTGYTETVSVPAETCIRKEFKVSFDEKGNNQVEIIASCNGEESKSSVDVYVEPVASSFDEMIKDVDAKLAELKSLLDECDAKGIETDYPLVDYTTIKAFKDKGWLEQDIGWGEYDRLYAEYDQICELYDRAKSELESYLKEAAEPLTGITHYRTGSVRTDGSVIYANTEKDGVVAERPFWFTGYGHFEGVAQSTDYMKNLGHSMIQIGMEPLYTIDKGSDGKPFSYNESAIVKRWQQYFKEAEDNDVQICLLLGVHSIPDWVNTTYSEIVGKSVADVIVQQGTVKLHPIYKELLRVHTRGIMESFGKYKSLHSICLTNEPTNNCDNVFYEGYWAQYLTQLYEADINKLNEAYGTNYESFLDVPMTTTVEESRAFYDYMQFNDDVMVEFHEVMAEVVKEYDPDMPVHVKTMTLGAWRDDPGRRNFLTYGTDYEKYIPFSDYAGNDACGYIQGNHWTLMDKLLNYDMLSGIVGTPAFNTEDHIIMDNDDVYTDPRYKKFVETDQWQGAMHGRGASAIWSWGRQNGASANAFYGLFLDRPDCMASAGRTALDINRLNYEMEALLTKEPDVCMLYSQSARMWNNAFMNIMNNAYENCLYNGQKVRFTTEAQAEKIHDYKVFIVPNATHVTDDFFAEVKKYAQSGKKLVVIGEDSMQYDNLGNKRDEAEVAAVMAKAQVIAITDNNILQTSPTKEEELDILHEIFEEVGIQNVELIDADTGERVNNCEFTYTNYNDGIVFNVVNYTWDTPKNLKIMIDGKEATDMTELRKAVKLNNEFTAEPYEPMMIQIGGVPSVEGKPAENNDGRFNDISKSHWANEAVDVLAEKNVIAGYDDNTFRPNGEITREEFVKMVVSALNIETSDETADFEDVDASKWYAKYVSAAYKNGIVSGKSENTFGIGAKITREEMAVIIRRALSEISETRQYDDFADSSDISDWATEAVKELYSAGIVNGLSDTEFAPKSIVTRAQAAKIIYDAFIK